VALAPHHLLGGIVRDRAAKRGILKTRSYPYIETHQSLNGLLVHAKGFPGWPNFSALVKHIQFIKNHHRKVQRVAIVFDGAILMIAPVIARHFAAAEIRQFPFNEMDRALAWLETGQ